MIEGQEDVTWDDWMAIAEVCERGGLEGLFRSDHYLSGDGRVGRGSLDAWTTLAAVAARTQRIRLGTMVSPVTFRHPSLLANAATTVDHVSGGRVELGLGAGWYELEHQVFGFPFPPLRERMEQLEEQLEVVNLLWSGDEVSFAGRHYRLDRCLALPRPLQSPRPPVIVGGGGKPRTVAAAVRFADEYNVVSGDVSECRALRRRLDDACERAGRDPATLVLSVMTTCVVGSRPGEFDRRAAELAEVWGRPGEGAALVREHAGDWITGTVDEAAGRLAELERAGVERVMLQHLVHRDLEMTELLGGELAGRIGAA